MTDNEINIAIAEATMVEVPPGLWYPLDEQGRAFGVPDYCGDLNVIHHAASELIKDGFLWAVYFDNLAAICEGACNPINATARQRAEALVLALGKWKEEA